MPLTQFSKEEQIQFGGLLRQLHVNDKLTPYQQKFSKDILDNWLSNGLTETQFAYLNKISIKAFSEEEIGQIFDEALTEHEAGETPELESALSRLLVKKTKST